MSDRAITKPDIATARKVVALINAAAAADRPAISALFSFRIPCNAALGSHPTIQIAPQHGGRAIGILGILNGFCGIDDDGRGLIEAVCDDVSGDLIRFQVSPRYNDPAKTYPEAIQ